MFENNNETNKQQKINSENIPQEIPQSSTCDNDNNFHNNHKHPKIKDFAEFKTVRSDLSIKTDSW